MIFLLTHTAVIIRRNFVYKRSMTQIKLYDLDSDERSKNTTNSFQNHYQNECKRVFYDIKSILVVIENKKKNI